MSTEQIQPRSLAQTEARLSVIARAAKLGRGVTLAGAVAAMSLSAIPTTARAGGHGNGAAIGLGILGGVIVGAAIAATAPPAYAAPPAYYPQQGYYYNSPPNYYYPPEPYYGSAAYSYPPYNYQ